MVFYISLFTATVMVSISMSLMFFLPYAFHYRMANLWVQYILWSLYKICGLRYVVEGAENISQGNGIILCKHQSAWETIALQAIFPPQIFILKREVLWLPFFGWAMALCDPIAIDRSKKTSSLQQIVKQGIQHLQAGRWVVVFPEGTRVAPGEAKPYHVGGAMLAQRSGYPVVPVAHNAGEFWARRSIVKYPGVIRVRIGPPIDTRHMKAKEINQAAQDWIESQMADLSRG